MWKNLYQKTIYEIYNSRKHLGYKLFEFEKMFAILWNNQQMSYFNMVHCDTFDKNNLAALDTTLPDTFWCISSNHIVDDLLSLKQGTPSFLMVLNAQNKFEENNKFKILKVSNQKTLSDFCNVVTDVYDMLNDKEFLLKSFSKELNLDNCFRYVGYINDQPASAIDFSEGTDAVCISWGATKKEFRGRGLYKAMLAYGINQEMNRGLTTFVLNSSEMGKNTYLKMGFKSLAERYNYVLERKV